MRLIDYLEDTFSKGIKKISGKEICFVNETIIPRPFEDFIDIKLESIDEVSIETNENNALIITPEITTIKYDWEVPWDSVIKIYQIYEHKDDIFIICSKDSIQTRKPIRIKSTCERRKLLGGKFKEKGKERNEMEENNKHTLVFKRKECIYPYCPHPTKCTEECVVPDESCLDGGCEEYTKTPPETKMDIDELKGDIRKLLFKYSSGTYVDNLTVNELKELEHDVYWLIKEGGLNKLISKKVDPEE